MLDFTPLNWNEFFDRKEILTYILFTSWRRIYRTYMGEFLSSQIECQIIAPDLCDHGDTQVENNEDMSAERMANSIYPNIFRRDVCSIYHHLYSEITTPPPLILIGHSMGGAIAIHIASSALLPNILIVSAIDVVEGSAMASLNVMHQFLRERPQTFVSIEKAIEYCMKNRVTSNLRAARVSMPSRLICFENSSGKKMLRWRTNLAKTEPFWKGWFKGLSKLFLSCEAVKVLILANIDRLDKELLTGQMKGQFQLEVMHKSGHAVHEDNPEVVAKIFVRIIERHKKILNL
ncbi:Protein phosphatase methylesterase 1 [Meloidogyne graminicola]|uniref:Protein phosphatase methylesterase 1 n=1 Tax=Meloidogyne graminicola TaxID=189291 RepID=A0A8T0A0Z2_9BILA|nr:Protein phosphatase methylesterase 1 [Meloidogyne graminicola]